MLRISILGLKWNNALFCLQFLLVIIHTTTKSIWINLVLLIVFIGIETMRHIGARRIDSLNRELNLLEEHQAHINETFRIVRNERHDFLKHVSVIHFMLENGKSDEAKVYLDELVEGYKETNLSIKGERGVVAGVLHQMYRRALASGISVVYDLDLPLSTLPLSDYHLVTLIGNLLSNSIDACEEWQNHQKEQALITLQFYKRSGLYLLMVKNNSMPVPTNILDNLFKTYGKTTKTGNHEGLGTKMIQEVVKNHQGYLDFVYKDEEFTVKMKFPAIK